MRQALMTSILAVGVALLPLAAAAQTPCDGPQPTELFVLPPDAPGVSFAFTVRTIDVPTISSYTLRLYRADANSQPTGEALSVQNVTAAATTAHGPRAGDPDAACYSLPVVPVSQIPRGVPLVATLVATGGVQELSSGESEPSNPLGQRLGPPALRVKP